VLYKDPSLPVAERAANLLSRMTLSGKVAQLVQFTPEHQAAARRVSFTLGPQELSYCGPGGEMRARARRVQGLGGWRQHG